MSTKIHAITSLELQHVEFNLFQPLSREAEDQERQRFCEFLNRLASAFPRLKRLQLMFNRGLRSSAYHGEYTLIQPDEFRTVLFEPLLTLIDELPLLQHFSTALEWPLSFPHGILDRRLAYTQREDAWGQRSWFPRGPNGAVERRKHRTGFWIAPEPMRIVKTFAVLRDLGVCCPPCQGSVSESPPYQRRPSQLF